jgi:hypothetical protein
MFDLVPITAEGKFVCNILPHKDLSRSQQHLMPKAPRDFPVRDVYPSQTGEVFSVDRQPEHTFVDRRSDGTSFRETKRHG